MGQGYSLTSLSAGAAGIDVPELADLVYEKSLGNARFMKCIRARSREGLVVAKVVMKPYSAMKLDEYVRSLACKKPPVTCIPLRTKLIKYLQTRGIFLQTYQTRWGITASSKLAQVVTWSASTFTVHYMIA